MKNFPKQLGLCAGLLLVGGGAGWIGHSYYFKSVIEDQDSELPLATSVLRTAAEPTDGVAQPQPRSYPPSDNPNFIAAAA